MVLSAGGSSISLRRLLHRPRLVLPVVIVTGTVIEEADLLEARALADWEDETHAGHRQIVQTD